MAIKMDRHQQHMPPEKALPILRDLRKHCCMMAREEEDADQELWEKRAQALGAAIDAFENIFDLTVELYLEYLQKLLEEGGLESED